MSKESSSLEGLFSSEGSALLFPQIDAQYRIEKVKTPACRVSCPAGVNIKSYIGLIAERKFDEALEVVRASNPLPGICGRVCTHPCESECVRGDVDEAVSICALKRFIADYELSHKAKTRPKAKKPTKKEKVAIVGSGPAGLTAANDLARMEYGVTIFEALPVPGGMLTACIPPFRLPRDIVEAEIDAIVGLGVELKTSSKVDDVEALLRKGYNAVFVAAGAFEGLRLNIPGEQVFKGVMDCIQFLKEVNLDNNKKKPGRKVAIIGGGNSALDSARTAVRLGCEEVHIIYRRSRREMPANPHEVDEAEREGIKIHYLAAPVRILGDRGKVTGMDCIRMELGEPDASGRRRPVPIKGSGYVVNADFIIPAISQRPDLSFLPKNHGFKITEWNTFAIDEETLESNVSGVFAGGDVATGPKTIIDAIGAGHRGATSIDRYLRGEKLKAARSCETEDFQLVVDGYEHAEMKRTDIPAIPIERRGGFDEVESAMDEEAAVREAKRCLRCGPCVECEACVASCWKKLMAVEGADDEGKRDILVQIPWAPERFPPGNGPWPASVTLKGKSRMEVEAEPVLSRVITRKCRGCGRCKDVCEYRAITLEESGKRLTAVIDPLLCRGCGTCTPVCPSSAIEPLHFGDSKLSRLLSAKG